MADIQSNFAIAITGMIIVSVIFVGFPIGCMLANSFRRRSKAEIVER